MIDEIEFKPILPVISGTMKITVRGPDGKVKNVETLEVKTE